MTFSYGLDTGTTIQDGEISPPEFQRRNRHHIDHIGIRVYSITSNTIASPA